MPELSVVFRTPSQIEADVVRGLAVMGIFSVNIVGMAMRKEAERRYNSAEQLGADIDRRLAAQPAGRRGAGRAA